MRPVHLLPIYLMILIYLAKSISYEDLYYAVFCIRQDPLWQLQTSISKYKFHSVWVQEVRWDRSCFEQARVYTLLYGKRNENHELNMFPVHKRIISAVKDSLSVMWCNRITFMAWRATSKNYNTYSTNFLSIIWQFCKIEPTTQLLGYTTENCYATEP
jgi:hypothetical protein